MKVKIARRELFNLLDTFEILKNLSGSKFAYAIVKNKAKIKKEAITLNTAMRPTKEYQEWETARIALCNKHCTKKDGKPVIENNKFVGLEKNKGFDKELNKLKVKFKETLDNYQKQVKEYNKKLTETIEFDLHLIDKKDLPVNITPVQLESILILIKE